MHFSYLTSTLNLMLLGVHVFMQIVAAILIKIKHHTPQEHSWRYISAFFAVSAIASIGEMIITLNPIAILDSYKLINPIIFIPGFYIFSLLWCYIYEIAHPKKLTIRRWLLLFSPSIILGAIILGMMACGQITDIYSLPKMLSQFSETEIWIRWLFIALFGVYGIAFLFLRSNQQETHNNSMQLYINILVGLIIAMCVSYIFSRCLQFFVAYIIHEALYLLITILILYAEYYERLHIPYETVRKYYNPKLEHAPSTTQQTITQVSIRLCNLMEDQTIWSNPELQRDDIVQIIGTNRTYIQQAAKVLGFKNVADMLYRRRIEYVCERLREHPNAKLEEIFYEAGFQSRSTAWRRFVEIVGSTPTEFIERITPPEKQYNQLIICTLA